METLRTTRSRAGEYAVDIPVSLEEGGVIRVAAGPVILEGRTDSLDEQIVVVPERASATLVFGYLAREAATDALVLFVDEHVQDGVDEAYVFDRDGPYRLLVYLFRVTIPGGTNDLRGLDYDRWRIVPEE